MEVLAGAVPTTPGVALVSQPVRRRNLGKHYLPTLDRSSTRIVQTRPCVGPAAPICRTVPGGRAIAAMLPSLLRRAIAQGALTAPALASALQPRFAASLAVQQSAE